MAKLSFETPLGQMTATEEEGVLIALTWGAIGDDCTPLLDEVADQVAAYFSGALTKFDLPIAPKGDAFQQTVCAAMSAIPFGETREYGQIAKSLGSAAQPVGAACGRNSIPIIIPCHRVVGADGLGGFSAPGGVEKKVALLRHEGAYSLLI